MYLINKQILRSSVNMAAASEQTAQYRAQDNKLTNVVRRSDKDSSLGQMVALPPADISGLDTYAQVTLTALVGIPTGAVNVAWDMALLPCLPGVL